ncbi:MAG: hypothetical protein Q8O19_03505, partial [Rectinemataceae bacterium]|nr:hypothetical protein [Rectinemataceae bacterium]
HNDEENTNAANNERTPQQAARYRSFCGEWILCGFISRHDKRPEKEDAWKQIETFCRYPVGSQSHPIKPGKQSEASLACSWGDSGA